RAVDRRRAAARPRPDGKAVAGGLTARALRRGVRHRDRSDAGQLPPGLLAPGADRGRRADHPRRAHRGALLMSDFDLIIIGTGAGGGTLARHLAPSGRRILLLERGDWLARERSCARRSSASSTAAVGAPPSSP